MQPFDALSMRAILAEANPVLLNRRVEKIQQISRDEVLISLRSKAGTMHLLVSAQASFGRICLVLNPPAPRGTNPPPFCQLLRKHLGSATLARMEQLPGERIVDLTFSCSDELGNRSTKILTAEIMGRHSNLILWDADSKKILGASHNVTAEMSRQREVAAGLTYARPPKQEKPGIFSVSKADFEKIFLREGSSLASGGAESTGLGGDAGASGLSAAKDGTSFDTASGSETGIDGSPLGPHTGAGSGSSSASAGTANGAVAGGLERGGEIRNFEQWLMANFAGLGRHLAEEIIEASRLPAEVSFDAINEENMQSLWRRIETIQATNEYKPSMRLDLTRFSVLSWWRESDSPDESLWKTFPSANDLVDAYFRGVQLRTEIQQLKDRIRSELRTEQDKLQQRKDMAEKLLEDSRDCERYKKFGDMILAHLNEIKPGQDRLNCEDLYSDNGSKTISIDLNPNISPSQNAQSYYRLFAKARTRSKTAEASNRDAREKLAEVQACSAALEIADNMQDLQVLKEKVLDRGKKIEMHQHASRTSAPSQARESKPGHQRLMSTKSSDGFTIIVGRNKNENDVLISRLTHPHDIWMHAQGLEGAHVLIKLPNKKDPPQTTLKEAAQIAARFARAGLGGRVKVVYTYGKYVRKIGKDKPGLVRYENEKTLEVDTAAPMPASVRRLFS